MEAEKAMNRRPTQVRHDDFTTRPESWPALPLDEWRDTRDTLHMWTQIVGKVALALAPPLNHWWGTTLRVTSSGLRTPLLPSGDAGFDMAFDFQEHGLEIGRTDGRAAGIRLGPRSVADFYEEFRARLVELAI